MAVFYIINNDGLVTEIRKNNNNRYLIEYAGTVHQQRIRRKNGQPSFKFVTRDAFFEIPDGCVMETCP